ncbi:MAG: hypothetical protein EPGJADBJ_00472 [Saprospiraceae bacterium]|nr:hypothetical protein [Saprospiraceae bacterium]
MGGQNTFNLAKSLPYPQGDFRHITLDNDTITGIGIGFNNNIEWKQGVVIAKLDSSGNVLTSNIILDSLDDAMAVGKAWGGIIKTADGGYAAIAATVERTSAFLIKLNNNLQLEFIKEYPDTVNLSNYFYKILETPEGYLLYGAIQRPDYYDDGFIRYVDKQGNTVWFKYVEYSDYSTTIQDMRKINDSTYVAGVVTESNSAQTQGFTSFLLFDLEGAEIGYWESPVEPEIGYNRKIVSVEDGNIIVYGLYVSAKIGNTILVQPTLSKLDSDFQIQWVSHFGSIRALYAMVQLWDFAPTADGHYIGAGETLVKDGDDPTRRVGWLYKFSPEGDSIWERKINAPFLPLYYTNSGFFGGVGVLSSSSIVAGGTTNEGNTDYCWLVKVTNDGCLDTLYCGTVATPEIPRTKGPLRVWPNPASDFIHIESPSPSGLEIVLYTPQGQVARQERIIGQTEISIAGLGSGVYFLEVRTLGGALLRRKVVIAR